jgi:hypothetical protein
MSDPADRAAGHVEDHESHDHDHLKETRMSETYSERYERGRDVLSSMGNDPNAIKGFPVARPGRRS